MFLVLFLAWGITMTAVYATRSTVCDTATTCTALGLPASWCDATGVIYGSACASSADCAHADTCCLNATGTSVKACSTTNQTACLKNSTASTHGVCKEVSTSTNLDVFITCEESGYCPGTPCSGIEGTTMQGSCTNSSRCAPIPHTGGLTTSCATCLSVDHGSIICEALPAGEHDPYVYLPQQCYCSQTY